MIQISSETAGLWKKIYDTEIIIGKKIRKNCLHTIHKDINECNKKFSKCIDPFKKHRATNVPNSKLINLNKKCIYFFQTFHSLMFTKEHKVCKVCVNFVESKISKYQIQTLLNVEVNFINDTPETSSWFIFCI